MFQDESEAAMIDILSLLSDIRQANLDEKEIYEITKDQCPEVGYKDVTIGEDKLSYLGIKCTDDFEPSEEEQQNVEFVSWNLEYGEKVKLMPGIKNKTYFNSTLGNAVIYSFFEVKENSPPLENEQSDNKLLELLILEKDIENFEKYLFPVELASEETIDVEKFLDDTETATKVASQYTSGTACNICVRSALYILKNDSTLFPSIGSGYNDPENNYISREIKGYITPDGRAIYIKSDFDNINNRAKLKERFVQIEKREDEDWEDYFKRLQNEADRGIIVIGVMLNSSGTVGHIMMITPGGLITVDEEEQSWGDTFVSRGIEKVPRVLECGDTDRENEAPLCRNVDRRGAKERLIWFKYIK